MTAERAELPVTGMTCASCARAIERTLASAPGVSNAHVNFATGLATVQFDPARTKLPQLVHAVEEIGYGVRPAEAPEPPDTTPRRFWIAAIFALPLLLLGMSGGNPWLELALCLPVMLYSALPFFSDAAKAARHGQANMNSLVSLGTGVAFVASVVITLRGGREVYFEAAAVITALVLLGRMLESRARARASRAVRQLLDLAPPTARVLRNGQWTEIPAAEVLPGDRLSVRPGERVPADGRVLSGNSAIDESMLTGESIPVDKAPGAELFAGTLNQMGALEFEATRVGRGTTLQQIVELVGQAQGSRAPVARLADVVSGYFTFAVLAIALLTAGVWLWRDPSQALMNAVAVLIIACPCALGLATPTAIIAGTGRGAERGILIKSGEALEAAARIDTVVLDKTGTVTQGRPEVVRFDSDEVLRLAAAVEQSSEHPLARAIVSAWPGPLAPVAGFRAEAGIGVTGTVEGRQVRVAKPAKPLDSADTVVEVWRDEERLGAIALADRIRPESPAAIAALRQAGFAVVLLTGDHEGAARAIAAQAGIDDLVANVLPAAKEQVIRDLQAQGKKVAMVGDGINDAPALARADLGIAIGAGSDIAKETGGIILVGNDLRGAAEALALARRTLRVIRQNLFWAFGYNLLALPLAAAGLLHPMIASAAMAFSSVSVVLNSLRLRRT